MFRPTACVWSRKIKPGAAPTSLKYSIGSTRTSAPVGQFSSHEYALRRAPDGFSGVASHRLHLIATGSSAGSAAAGRSFLKLKAFRRFEAKPETCGGGVRGTIVIASYGHCDAQSKQPMHVCGSISTCPSGSRKIAPVGQPVKHSGSAQCMQTCGTSAC